MIPWKLISYAVVAALVIGLATIVYFHILHTGEQKVIDQEKAAFDKLKEKTDAAKDDANTTPTPDDSLRKFERPGP